MQKLKWSISIKSLLTLFLAPVAWNTNIHLILSFDFYPDIISFLFVLHFDIQEKKSGQWYF